ncbi:hypothetical protein [Pseudoxanthomonas sp. JBR18]|uniref:hypothetical protein n=1 Tax=Pseudoxanthomonas sp. JBR18 TaxID=2969308 RepID=UPI0023068287|nr:hypothetical protein [Pseudoxanthomonas sp. JBR18]WCE04792.1 hypothetical protein PJ250_01995 [Pseudoxanthomonas sp. JBR18]
MPFLMAASASCLAADVQGNFQIGTMPKFAGIQADIYITGGNTVDYTSNFVIKANGNYLCNTADEAYSSTPIRHCKATIAAPGTYTISATPSSSSQNFKAPADVIINVD